MRKYETYELLQYTAMLGALVELGVAIKIPIFRAALPFTLLPMTVCAGAAAHLHRKLPKDKKCSLLSKSHPANFFVGMLLVNAVSLLGLVLGVQW